jgi:cobalt/nickel transport system ATP-binding protein
LAGNIIETAEISYTYPDGTRALDELSIAIPAGAKVAVLGANGSGKTTFFLCLNGILKPQKGVVFFHGKPLKHDRKSLNELRRRVGIVFQDPDVQLFSPSVLEEIAFGPLNLGLNQQEVLQRVQKAIEATGIPNLKEKATHLLSYGQKKRVSIADILAMGPEVVVSDEPTAWLDQEHAEKIMQLFNEINSEGTTVIISTHDSDLAYSWADEVIILQQGKALNKGNPVGVFQNEDVIQKAGLKKPYLLEMYLYLQERGYIQKDRTAPKTMKELEKIIL